MRIGPLHQAVVIALVALVNGVLGWLGHFVGGLVGQPVALSLQAIFGWMFAPIAWAIIILWANGSLTWR